MPNHVDLATGIRTQVPLSEKLEDRNPELGTSGDSILNRNLLEGLRPPVSTSEEERPELVSDLLGVADRSEQDLVTTKGVLGHARDVLDHDDGVLATHENRQRTIDV